MEILLIAGKKGSGKDYLASLIIEELNKKNIKAKQMAFADNIKDMLCKTLNVGLDDFNEYKNKRSKIYVEKSHGEFEHLTDFRSLIQTFGTDVMQEHFGKSVWVDMLLRDIDESDDDICVISDFRFDHEEISNKKILIYNKDLDTSDTHLSENGLKGTNFQMIIDNTGKRDLSLHVKEIEKFLLN